MQIFAAPELEDYKPSERRGIEHPAVQHARRRTGWKLKRFDHSLRHEGVDELKHFWERNTGGTVHNYKWWIKPNLTLRNCSRLTWNNFNLAGLPGTWRTLNDETVSMERFQICSHWCLEWISLNDVLVSANARSSFWGTLMSKNKSTRLDLIWRQLLRDYSYAAILGAGGSFALPVKVTLLCRSIHGHDDRDMESSVLHWTHIEHGLKINISQSSSDPEVCSRKGATASWKQHSVNHFWSFSSRQKIQAFGLQEELSSIGTALPKL